MPLVLFHKNQAHPWFEVLGVTDKGRKLEVRPLWFRPDQAGLVYTVDKEAFRKYGYYPKEVPDAELPQLRP
jgi:hypothetical protein